MLIRPVGLPAETATGMLPPAAGIAITELFAGLLIEMVGGVPIGGTMKRFCTAVPLTEIWLPLLS